MGAPVTLHMDITMSLSAGLPRAIMAVSEGMNPSKDYIEQAALAAIRVPSENYGHLGFLPARFSFLAAGL